LTPPSLRSVALKEHELDVLGFHPPADRELNVEDLQAAASPALTPKTPKKRGATSLEAFLKSADPIDLAAQARTLWAQGRMTAALFEGFQNEASRARAQRPQQLEQEQREHPPVIKETRIAGAEAKLTAAKKKLQEIEGGLDLETLHITSLKLERSNPKTTAERLGVIEGALTALQDNVIPRLNEDQKKASEALNALQMRYDSVLDELESAQNYYVHMHTRPDPDTPNGKRRLDSERETAERRILVIGGKGPLEVSQRVVKEHKAAAQAGVR
jgi:hypothetical protein